MSEMGISHYKIGIYKVNNIYKVRVTGLTLFVCQSFGSFTSFWSAITLCRQTHCQYNESTSNDKLNEYDAVRYVDFIHEAMD